MKFILKGLKLLILFIVVGVLTVAIGNYLNLFLPWKIFVVKTGSMGPTIPAGSLVFVSEQGKSNISISYVAGDVITFRSGNNLITHRIVEVREKKALRYFVTKGDANKTFDSKLVPMKDVVGRVSWSIPYFGRLVDFVKTPLGFILLVIVPIFLIIFSEVLVIVDEIHRKNSKSGNNADFAKPVTLFFLASVFLSGTHAFFSDVAISNNNTFATASDFSNLKINEFVANPQTIFVKEFVEIFNAGTSSVDLTGWFLVDSSSQNKSLTPLGVISPGGFKVFETSEGWLNNTGGDTVSLINPLNTVVDSYTYSGSVGADVSIGRDANGTGVFKVCTVATKGSSNNGSC